MSGIADKDYYLDAEGNIAESDETAATLLIRAGQEVPKEMADQYGIGVAAEAEESEAKSEKPSKNKAVKPKADKGE